MKVDAGLRAGVGPRRTDPERGGAEAGKAQNEAAAADVHRENVDLGHGIHGDFSSRWSLPWCRALFAPSLDWVGHEKNGSFHRPDL